MGLPKNLELKDLVDIRISYYIDLKKKSRTYKKNSLNIVVLNNFNISVTIFLKDSKFI